MSQTSKSPCASTPTPPGDHRKRRRNRTTQSCLNCHASKRMCDRKRPACQRCTTLGLTGLCVYEVDDPSQRGLSADEKILLRKRVAELEGVIREMKNKPHPRWAQKSSGGQAQSPQSADDDPTLLLVAEESHPKDDSGDKAKGSQVDLNTSGIHLNSVCSPSGGSTTSGSPVTPQDPHFPSTFGIPTPPSSSSLSSPAYSHRMLPPVAVNDGRSVNPSVFSSVDSLITNACLQATGFEDGIYGHMLDRILQADQASALAACNRDTACSQGDATCGCINNATVYSSLLELSVRLRKAVELLSRVSDHEARSFGPECQLYKRVRDLDMLTSSTLGNTATPADRQAVGDSYLSSLSAEFVPPTISPNCLTNMQQWESVVNRASIPGTSDDDSFMSWNGISRENWPHVARP